MKKNDKIKLELTAEEAQELLYKGEQYLYAEMGRLKGKMIKKVENLIDTIQEHLWKVFAYHKHQPNNINGWLVSLNKHLPRFRIFNEPKGKGNFNLSKEFLYDQLTDTMFGKKGDIKILIGNFSTFKGYPKVKVSEKDRQKLLQLSNKYVDLIFKKEGKFKVEESELL